jgi:large subunit ribosomal protein L15
MKIHELRPGLNRKQKKRVGRGPGSGHGKTSCRGHKGQKARAGFELRASFEGGQMPLIRRIPKRGFVNKFRKVYQVVNLSWLNQKFEKDAIINPLALKEKGLISKIDVPVKILADGELEKALVIKAHGFSKRAKEEIEKKGGKTELIL